MVLFQVSVRERSFLNHNLVEKNTELHVTPFYLLFLINRKKRNEANETKRKMNWRITRDGISDGISDVTQTHTDVDGKW